MVVPPPYLISTSPRRIDTLPVRDSLASIDARVRGNDSQLKYTPGKQPQAARSHVPSGRAPGDIWPAQNDPIQIGSTCCQPKGFSLPGKQVGLDLPVEFDLAFMIKWENPAGETRFDLLTGNVCLLVQV